MENYLPKISVITVCYNAAHLLRKTIESVIEQSYERIEYIIVDGGSSDLTKSIVFEFQKKIDLFISEPDDGIYDAMNKGIKNATGDLIIFLNAGDHYISSNALKYAVTKMNFQNADIFYGRILWEDPFNKDIVLSDHHLTRYEWDLKFSNFPHPATFYKKKLFKEFGLFDETFKILGDYEWNAKALVKNRIPFQYINVAIGVFRADGISNSITNSDKIQQETKEIYQRYFKPGWLFSFVEKHNDKREGYSIKEKVLAKIYHKKLNRIY